MENKKLKFIVKEDSIVNAFKQLENDSKRYNRLIEFLETKGNFDGKTELELYEVIDKRHLKEIKLFCSDKNDIIYILRSNSTKKENQYKVDVIDNYDEKSYNISLLKKCTITNDNIELSRTKEEYTFNYGRLITDGKTFFNLFLGDNICYEVKTKCNSNCPVQEQLLKKLNQCKIKPSFMDFIKIMEESNKDIHVEEINLYKDYKKGTSIILSAEQVTKENICKQKGLKYNN